MFTIIDDINYDTDGVITDVVSYFELNPLHGRRLKQLIAVQTDTNNESLTLAGQFKIRYNDTWFPLNAVDLFDMTEGLIWEGDLLIEQTTTGALRWANGDAANLNVRIRILAVWE